MTDYKKYINALRKCAKEHENDKTFTGHTIVTALCQDTANLLEELELKKEPRWIPCSERLPEDSGEYLVSIIDEYNENQRYYKAVGIAWFAHKKDYDIKESEWRELGIDETVIAWMPLPKPYKAESEG